MPSKQNLKAINEWQQEHLERIIIKPNKKERISERIQVAIDKGYARSRQGFILDAVRKALEELGITCNEEGPESK